MRPYILYDVNEQKTVLRFKYVHTDEHFDYSHCVPADSANAAKERLDALWEKIQAKRANKKKILEKLLARVGSVAILLVVVLTWFGVKNGVPALFVTSAVLGGGCGWFIWVAWSNRDEIVTNRGADLTEKMVKDAIGFYFAVDAIVYSRMTQVDRDVLLGEPIEVQLALVAVLAKQYSLRAKREEQEQDSQHEKKRSLARIRARKAAKDLGYDEEESPF